jgi:hypothetical protein
MMSRTKNSPLRGDRDGVADYIIGAELFLMELHSKVVRDSVAVAVKRRKLPDHL